MKIREATETIIEVEEGYANNQAGYAASILMLGAQEVVVTWPTTGIDAINTYRYTKVTDSERG